MGEFSSKSAWSIVTPLKFNSSSGLPVPSQPGDKRTGSAIKFLINYYNYWKIWYHYFLSIEYYYVCIINLIMLTDKTGYAKIIK